MRLLFLNIPKCNISLYRNSAKTDIFLHKIYKFEQNLKTKRIPIKTVKNILYSIQMHDRASRDSRISILLTVGVKSIRTVTSHD